MKNPEFVKHRRKNVDTDDGNKVLRTRFHTNLKLPHWKIPEYILVILGKRFILVEIQSYLYPKVCKERIVTVKIPKEDCVLYKNRWH